MKFLQIFKKILSLFNEIEDMVTTIHQFPKFTKKLMHHNWVFKKCFIIHTKLPMFSSVRSYKRGFFCSIIQRSIHYPFSKRIFLNPLKFKSFYFEELIQSLCLLFYISIFNITPPHPQYQWLCM